jgi:hypothetical protein
MANVRDNRPRQQSIELHIEELVLHGFPHGDRYAIAEAVASEIGQLLMNQSAGGVPTAFTKNSEQERVDAGVFNAAPGWSSKSLGGQIAQTVHRGLTK